MKAETIILAGGGTGGHVFPLIAVADELRNIHPGLRIVFVGTERGIESQVVPERGYELELVDLLPVRGGGVSGALKGLKRAAAAIPEAVRLVHHLSPKVVLSIGGYAATSVSFAARLARIPLALLEPNSVIGWANRAVAPWVQRAYTTYSEVEKYFPAGSVLRTGLAMRRGFSPRDFELPQGPLQVLILGGSQGAKTLNENLPAAISQLGDRVSVVHQAGKGKDSAVRSLYARLGYQAQVVPFIRDMPEALAKAHLVVGRAGAGAVSELCAVGRPSILVPYPYASGDHQYHNAAALERANAAVCIRNEQATTEHLAEELRVLVEAPQKLCSMASAAKAIGRPEASEVIAQDLLQLGNVDLSEARDVDELDLEEQASVTPSEVH